MTMHRQLTRLLMAALTVCGMQAAPPTSVELGGWVSYWALDPGLKSVAAAKGGLADVFLFALHLDEAGHPVFARKDKDYAPIVAGLHDQKVRVWLTICNDYQTAAGKLVLKDAALVHALCADPARRRAHVTELVGLCTRLKADGLDLDYENLNPEDRTLVSQFVTELGEALHGSSLQLSVTVQPKQKESASVGPGAADWVALGKAADRVQIMLYNQHNTRTAPGPVASPAWMQKVLDFAATQIEPARIVPALKISGFEWGATPREVDFKDLAGPRAAAKAPAARDPESSTPILTYTVAGDNRTAYVEDAVSIRASLAFLQSRGFKRATLWSLGVEDPALWQ